jgi:anti-anti-sigma factor
MTAHPPPEWLLVERVGGDVVVRLLQSELFDEEAIDCFGEQMHDLLDGQGCHRLVLHLGAVERMASHMVGELIVLQKKVRTRSGKLILCGLNQALRETFEILKLDQVFSIRETQEQALEALRDL